ncbi:MAG: DUF5908 family protein [Synechococcaceae cyanobacterium]|jgi:hypothetical protein
MTIEIRHLVIRAVVEAPPSHSHRRSGKTAGTLADEASLVARCTRSVLQALEQMKER